MNTAKLSVMMCVYGGDNAEHFNEALASVFNQTRLPDEMVLVVDGPVPTEIDDVIAVYVERHGIKVIRLPENRGHGEARREGFRHCTHEFVAIADADDINMPTRFEKELAVLVSDAEIGAVSSACVHFTGTTDNVLNEEFMPLAHDDIVRYMKKRCPICQASVMLRRSFVLLAGGYQDWYYAEDYYLWVRMYLAGAKFANLEDGLLYLRTDEAQIGRRGGYRYFKSMRDLFRFMRRNKIIGFTTYCYNVMTRFVMQVLMPARLRAWVRKKLL